MNPNIRSEEREIGGRRWTVTTLSADEGVELLPELAGYAGPAVGKALAALQGGVELSNWEELLPAAGEGLQEFSRALSRPEAGRLLKRLVTREVRCDGEPVTAKSFGATFAGDYGTLLKVALFVIEVNFKLPLSSWLSAAGDALAAAKKTLTPTSPQPGSSASS